MLAYRSLLPQLLSAAVQHSITLSYRSKQPLQGAISVALLVSVELCLLRPGPEDRDASPVSSGCEVWTLKQVLYRREAQLASRSIYNSVDEILPRCQAAIY